MSWEKSELLYLRERMGALADERSRLGGYDTNAQTIASLTEVLYLVLDYLWEKEDGKLPVKKVRLKPRAPKPKR